MSNPAFKADEGAKSSTINRLYQAKLGLSACLIEDLTGGAISVEKAIENANSILHAVRPVTPDNSISAVSAEIMSFYLGLISGAPELTESIISDSSLLDRLKKVTSHLSARDFEMIRMNQNLKVSRMKLSMAAIISAEQNPLLWSDRKSLAAIITDNVFLVLRRRSAALQNYVFCSMVDTFAQHLPQIWDVFAKEQLSVVKSLSDEEIRSLLTSLSDGRGLDVSGFTDVIDETVESINNSMRGLEV